MAVVLVVAGGFMGFVSAMVAVLVLGAGLLAALAIWSLVGIVFVGLGLVVAHMPRAGHDTPSLPEHV